MPITEILVPQLNTSPECIKVFNETWPTIGRQAFATRPSIDSQYQGWILSEDNKDVQNEHKYLILLEWHAKSDFDAFLVSSELQSMIGASKAFMAGPPTIQLFETDASPASSATAPLTVIVRTTIRDPGNREAAGKVWSGLAKDIGGEAKGFTHGASVNLEEELYLGVLGWESMEAMHKEDVKGAFETALERLHQVGATSLIILKLDAIKKE